MKVHYLLHVPFETPGSISSWAKRKGALESTTFLYETLILPAMADFDVLVVMGGPMSVHDDKIYPWLKWEKEFIEETIRAGKMVVGICLGAQLIADVFGARVYTNPHKEIGWFPINWTDKILQRWRSPSFEPHMTVFHWHGETFDLPRDCVHLAGNDHCINQAFSTDHVLALQFHLEVKPENIRLMLDNMAHELEEAPYIQSVEEIEQQVYRCSLLEPVLKMMLDKFVKDAEIPTS